MGPGEPGDVGFDALRARVAALASLTPTVEQPEAPDKTRAGFGVKQRFTLTRLIFPADSLGAERVLVAQSTFIGRTDLESWRVEPPSWAVPVAPDRDGVVDGLAAEDEVVFYALLVRTAAGWTAATLTPSSPPFADIERPLVLGDARGRLLAALAASSSDALSELLRQALAPIALAGSACASPRVSASSEGLS